MDAALAIFQTMKAESSDVEIARWAVPHRRFVVVGWLIAAVAIFAISGSVGKKTASSFTLPGTDSQRAVNLLQSRFPTQAGDADQVVFHARTGTLRSAWTRAAVDGTLARIVALPHVSAVVGPYAPGSALDLA
jgi:putative drug exporter of the RND superfamily